MKFYNLGDQTLETLQFIGYCCKIYFIAQWFEHFLIFYRFATKSVTPHHF